MWMSREMIVLFIIPSILFPFEYAYAQCLVIIRLSATITPRSFSSSVSPSSVVHIILNRNNDNICCNFCNKILISVIMHSITTMQLWSKLSRFSDWLQSHTAQRLRKKTFRIRTHSISERWLSQIKTCANVYATFESFLSKMAFVRKLSDVFVQNAMLLCKMNTLNN